MNCLIRTTIRAFAAPEHRLSCPRRLWQSTLRELRRRGGGLHESGAFLLGYEARSRRSVSDVVFYDELDPAAYDTGICVLDGHAFAKLWNICRERRLTVVADVHTHATRAIQSHEDRTNPMIARADHVAIIVPNFAAPPTDVGDLGLYEYRGNHTWRTHSGRAAGRFFYVGFWS